MFGEVLLVLSSYKRGEGMSAQGSRSERFSGQRKAQKVLLDDVQERRSQNLQPRSPAGSVYLDRLLSPLEITSTSPLLTGLDGSDGSDIWMWNTGLRVSRNRLLSYLFFLTQLRFGLITCCPQSGQPRSTEDGMHTTNQHRDEKRLTTFAQRDFIKSTQLRVVMIVAGGTRLSASAINNA